MCVFVCVCVFFVPYARPQFSARNLACGIRYPTDGHSGEEVSDRCLSTLAHAPRAVYTPLQMSGELRRAIRN